MVHRDPETGQFLAHEDADEPLDLTYSDHEFLNFHVAVEDDGGEASETEVTYQIESDVLDLENDELGMLSWLNCSMSLVYEQFPESGGETTRGGAYAIAEIGANLAGNEYLGASQPGSGVQIVDDDGDATSFQLNASDDPGIWAHLNASAMSGFKDADADGSYSGGGSPDNDRIRRAFYEETSGGPYIDATDDVNVGVFFDKAGTQAGLRASVYGQMAFVVFEYENRRAEFAPYDPGPSM